MRKMNGAAKAITLFLLAAGWTVPLTLAKAKLDDAGISKAAEAKITADKIGKEVQVKVDNGVVTLDGTVNTIDQVERTGKAVAKLVGVEAVNNNLRVTTSIDDMKIAENAARQIRCYAYYSIFDDVDLEVHEGKLKLSGQVLTPYRKRDISALMKGVAGVREIEDSLEVLPLSPYDDAIRLRVAGAIYRDPVLFRYGIGANPPIHIIVKNGNVRLTGVVHSKMEKQMAERAARFAALYFGFQNDLLVEEEMAKKG
jgi:hyperosmotically inducible protein